MTGNIFLQELIYLIFYSILFWLAGYTFGKAKSIIVTVFMFALLIYLSHVNPMYTITAERSDMKLTGIIFTISAITKIIMFGIGMYSGKNSDDDLDFGITSTLNDASSTAPTEE